MTDDVKRRRTFYGYRAMMSRKNRAWLAPSESERASKPSPIKSYGRQEYFFRTAKLAHEALKRVGPPQVKEDAYVAKIFFLETMSSFRIRMLRAVLSWYADRDDHDICARRVLAHDDVLSNSRIKQGDRRNGSKQEVPA